MKRKKNLGHVSGFMCKMASFTPASDFTEAFHALLIINLKVGK